MNEEFNEIRRLAADIRIQIIREMEAFGSGHIGGCMSVADLLAVLYGRVMRYRADEPDWDERDYLVFSKGHCGPAQYAALALKGFFPMEWLQTLNRGGTKLPSHCDRSKTPGVDATTGSLGQGISIASGLAKAGKLRGDDSIVYAVVGDGELQEGQVWEAVQFAVHQKLNNFVILLDNNGKQLDGAVEDICIQLDVAEKFRSFGCDVHELNGHDVEAISKLLEAHKSQRGERPLAVILKTIKGCGCVFAESVSANHHMVVNAEDAARAIDEIERRFAAGLLPGGDAA
jgi:transketolase